MDIKEGATMTHSISPRIQEEIYFLCSQISITNSLDPEVAEELKGHMEDKLLAYMDGEEQLTEQDAFILVREHFGDPMVIEGLLQEVHGLAVNTSPRLVAAIGCINTAFGITGLLISMYGTVAGLLIIQNAVNLVGRDNLLAGPYPPVLINFILLSQSCLLLVSGIGLLRRKAWGRTWSLVCAFYMLAAAPMVQWVAYLGGNNAPGSLITMSLTLLYGFLIIFVMTRVSRKQREQTEL